jgi:E3 ubiquitin-protein ligase MARCH6
MLWCVSLLLMPSLPVVVEWAGNHFIPAVSICWGIGIAYMLCTTISILQLREVLHPDLLAKYIRPQEGQVDLLASLLLEPIHVQARRLVMSFLVYAVITAIIVLAPILVVRTVFASYLPLKLHLWYLSVDLQVCVEVTFLHTLFLMMLEKYKDMIGVWEHQGLLYLTKVLGINRLLLPYSMHILPQVCPLNSICLFSTPLLKNISF